MFSISNLYITLAKYCMLLDLNKKKESTSWTKEDEPLSRGKLMDYSGNRQKITGNKFSLSKI